MDEWNDLCPAACIRWHDGAQFTPDDVVFTAEVALDRNLPIVRPELYGFVDGIEGRDTRTIVVHWKEPYILADTIFGGGGGLPLPNTSSTKLGAIARRTSQPSRIGVVSSSGWDLSDEGLGRGSHVVVEANPDYVLGRPKVDVIEVRFVPSPTTMMANILAGRSS